MQTSPADLGRLDRGNPPTTALRRGALESGLLARRRLLLLHFHLQHWIQDALHFQGTYNSDGGGSTVTYRPLIYGLSLSGGLDCIKIN